MHLRFLDLTWWVVYHTIDSRITSSCYLCYNKALKIWINLKKGELDDSKGLAQDISNIGYWGNGDYELQVSDDDNLEYIISLIKQSYKKNSK